MLPILACLLLQVKTTEMFHVKHWPVTPIKGPIGVRQPLFFQSGWCALIPSPSMRLGARMPCGLSRLGPTFVLGLVPLCPIDLS
jgi:hypothetical protein